MRRRAWKSVKSEARRLTNKAGEGRRDAREKPTPTPHRSRDGWDNRSGHKVRAQLGEK